MFVVSASCSFEMVYVLSTLKSEHSLCAGSGDPCNGNQCWCGLKGSNGDVFPCPERVRTSTVWKRLKDTLTRCSRRRTRPVMCSGERSEGSSHCCRLPLCQVLGNGELASLLPRARCTGEGCLVLDLPQSEEVEECRCSHSKFWPDQCSESLSVCRGHHSRC